MPQELIIKPVLNGFIVVAGCQTLVYDNPEKIKMDFAEWVNDPEKVEKRYMELMSKKGIPTPAQCAPPSVLSEPRVAAQVLRDSGAGLR